ncbi:MAG: hypothetical protein KBD47_01905 [Candidatus Pacebacteria bacterium]|jgi:hypothetical protein|nr:hypothetical protein [Candidatus Paceibacterota bacterium]
MKKNILALILSIPTVYLLFVTGWVVSIGLPILILVIIFLKRENIFTIIGLWINLLGTISFAGFYMLARTTDGSWAWMLVAGLVAVYFLIASSIVYLIALFIKTKSVDAIMN